MASADRQDDRSTGASAPMARVLRADDPHALDQAAELLARGDVVALPTETVYGLAGVSTRSDAIARIYAVKRRPSHNPLISHVADMAMAERYAHMDEMSFRLAQAFWPGPLTLVLPRRGEAQLAAAVTAGLPTVAVRCPAHPVMRELLAMCDFPLAAPSANRSGFISPTTPDHVLASLDGRIDMVLDGGASAAGLESTIVAVRGDGAIEVLRPGPLDLGGLASSGAGIEAPGQMASHYAPGKPVRLGATEVAPDEFFIGFGAIAGDCTLSASGDLVEAAAQLYACLHHGALSAKPRIAVAPVPTEGIGIAINDRLRRAATPA